MRCIRCFNKMSMVCVDKTSGFGNYDKYFQCFHCQARALIFVRKHKLKKISFYDSEGKEIKCK